MFWPGIALHCHALSPLVISQHDDLADYIQSAASSLLCCNARCLCVTCPDLHVAVVMNDTIETNLQTNLIALWKQGWKPKCHSFDLLV